MGEEHSRQEKQHGQTHGKKEPDIVEGNRRPFSRRK